MCRNSFIVKLFFILFITLTHSENKDDNEEEEEGEDQGSDDEKVFIKIIYNGVGVQKHELRSIVERNIELQPISLSSRNTFTMCHCKINTL